MSVETAIRAAVKAGSPGAIVTGWALVVECVDPDVPDSTAFVYDSADGQGVAHTLGLLGVARNHHLGRIGDAGGTP
jgi:hypothetical protein